MKKGFTVPRSDLDLEFFRAGGKGGQKQNKTSSACRITHIPSGAVGESRDHRQQVQNRKTALARLSKNKAFVAWCKMQLAAQEEGHASMEKKIDAAMAEANLKVELGVDCKRGESICVKS